MVMDESQYTSRGVRILVNHLAPLATVIHEVLRHPDVESTRSVSSEELRCLIRRQ